MITKYKSRTRKQPGVASKISGEFVRKRFDSQGVKTGAVIHPDNKLKVIVLGGLEEVGRNMTLFEYDGEIIIIDMGLQFPEEDMPGIDYIIPNVSYLEDKTDMIKGVIITHGHYDHIGGIPHLMGKLGNPPMFMGRLTAGIVRKRGEEFNKSPKLNIAEINEDSKLKLGR
jgi:ribonuclease J